MDKQSALTVALTDLDDPGKTVTFGYAPVERGGFGMLAVEIRARGLICEEEFLTLAGDALDVFLIAVGENLRPGRTQRRHLDPWTALTDRMRIAAYGSGHGVELRLELSPDWNPGYWGLETSVRARPASVGQLGPDLGRAFAEPPRHREPPRLPAVGVHAVTVDEAQALAADAQRLGWPVFRMDGPSTEEELLEVVRSTFPLNPPHSAETEINWDALEDSWWQAIDDLCVADVLIWWEEAGRLAPGRDALLRPTHSRETYSTLMHVLTKLALELADPKYTVDDPTRVTILVSGSLRDVGLPGDEISRLLTPVVFAIGDRPEVPGDDAVELAELLERRGTAQQFETAGHSLTAITLASRIREQAGVFPNGQPLPDDYEKIEDDIQPDGYDLIVLSQVLAVEAWPKSRPWFECLQDEVDRQIGPASD
jgi:hypothetical protein